MKITQSQLRRIIKEELARVVKEASWSPKAVWAGGAEPEKSAAPIGGLADRRHDAEREAERAAKAGGASAQSRRSPEEMKKEHDELLWGAYEAIRRDEHAGLTGAVGYIKRAAQIERQLGFKPGSLRWSGRGAAAPLKLSYGTRDTNYDDPREWMARYRKQRGVREDLGA